MPRIIGRVTFFPPPNSADSQFSLVMVILPPFLRHCLQALQLLGHPVTPAPLLVCDSSLVGCLSKEPSTAQVTWSLHYVVGENRASAIGHTSDYMNHDTTLPPSYTEQSSRHTWGSGDISILRYLHINLTGPMMGLGSICSLHDHAYGQMVGSYAPWSWISNPLLPLLQELHPSGDFTHGNIPPEQTKAGMVVLPQLLSSFMMQSMEHIHPWTPFPYTNPIPPQSNSMAYSNSDGYISSYSSLLMPNQNSSSWSLQEHLGYPLPVHPHYVRPVYLPGFHGIDSGRKMELHASGTLDDYAAWVISDQSSHTPSDHKTHLRSHSTHIPNDHTTDGRVGDYGNFGERKPNLEQIVGLGPQLQLPPNQFSLSPPRIKAFQGHSIIQVALPVPSHDRSDHPRHARMMKAKNVVHLLVMAIAQAILPPPTASGI
ncbi:hypothetical protein BKA83DRAFT_4126691 [Pisolithus microcarpus]|nr:hypothetical protein BKA83DRAFT_4126691 [Pisolithus microcarpus]